MKLSKAVKIAISTIVLLLTGCQNWVQSSPALPTPTVTATPLGHSSIPTASDKGIVYSLLDDNLLIAASVQEGTILYELRLAPTPTDDHRALPGHLLAVNKDQTALFALIPGGENTNDLLSVVDLAGARIRNTYPLRLEGMKFYSLDVGQTSGKLYLFGNQDKAPVVAVIDPASGDVLALWRARESDGYNFQIYQGRVSNDEHRLFLSYHSDNVGGIDWFDVEPGGLRRCQSLGRTCLKAHGGFILYGDDVLAATGSNVILELDLNGNIRRAFDTHLPNNHLMEFAIDRSADQLYAVGPCGYAGGFSTLTLHGGGVPTTPTVLGEWTWLATPAPPNVLVEPGLSESTGVPCGERLARGSGTVLVIGRTASSLAQSGSSGALLYLDVTTGHTVRSVATPATPIDVLVVPR